MKQLLILLLISVFTATSSIAQDEYIEVNAPSSRVMKLAITDPYSPAAPYLEGIHQAAEVISSDINLSGVAVADSQPGLNLPQTVLLSDIDFKQMKDTGFDLLVRSSYSLVGQQLTLEFRLFDAVNHKVLTAQRYIGTKSDLRRFSHLFANEIVFALTGEKGYFSTRIAYISNQTGNKEIFIMDWDGHNPRQLTKNGSINMNPDFSPDGTSILFTSYKKGNPDLYRHSISNGSEVTVSARKGLNLTGSWSPDGTKIAVSLSKDGDSEIYTLSKDGSNPMRLTINPALDLSPTWSPDGTKIAFVSDRLGKPQIFIMNADGGNVRRLTTSGKYNVNPRWSPKGDRIAYSQMNDGVFSIHTISPDGSSDTKLTSEGSNENPAWSPDGRFICFSSKKSSGSGIYVMRSDGSGVRRVSGNRGSYSQPAWSSN